MADYLIFRISDARVAVEAHLVQEVVHLPRLFRPPTAPSFLEGFLDLGGRPVPVLGLDRLFGLPEAPRDLYTTVVLVIDSERELLGLVSQEVDHLARVGPDDALAHEPGSSFNDAVAGVIRTESGPAHLLSMEKLLLKRERTVLEEYRRMEQQRLAELKGDGHPEPEGDSGSDQAQGPEQA